MATAFDTLPAPATASKQEYSQDERVTAWSMPALWAYLMEDVDPSRSTLPLSSFCFMTGFMYVFYFVFVPYFLLSCHR